jgi:uncharacterized protein
LELVYSFPPRVGKRKARGRRFTSLLKWKSGLDLHKNLCNHIFVILFEYDPIKSKVNTEKHGIDFKQAQALWLDENLVVLASKFPEEQRFLAIGCINNIPLTAVFTERGEKIRLISVRHSRTEEKELYEQNEQIKP